MIWILVIIAVIAIYNAERLPDLVNKFKKDMPAIVEAGKKASKELKEKAQQTVAEKKAEKKKAEKDETEE